MELEPTIRRTARPTMAGLALALASLALLVGCSGAPKPSAVLEAPATPRESPPGVMVAEATPDTVPSSDDTTTTSTNHLEVPRIDTPPDPAFPTDSQVIHAWELVYHAALDLESTEPDSALFFRYQAMLTHLDPGMIDPAAAQLRDRAVSLRSWIARSRDAAWERWQVDLMPPPEPSAIGHSDAAAIVPAEHPRVTKWIERFTGPSRERFSTWIWRSGAYRPLMEAILVEEGVPRELIVLVFIESGFSLAARSRASAVGPWQFIRETGKRYGLVINNHRDERRDFVLATRAAARYLRDLHDYFGDWNLAMAAYNCGEGRVFRQISRQGSNDFWALDLPRETEDYVPEFHAALTILNDPAAYGFSMDLDQPLDFVEHPLPAPVRVADLAQYCALSIEQMKLLNPSWLRGVTPADGKPVMARIPGNLSTTISLASLPLAPAEETVARGGTHKVRKGDTLSGIARKYGVSLNTLARENGMTTRSKLKVGKVLQLPDGAGGLASKTGTGKKKSGTATARTGATVHTVRKGDTLSAICSRYGVRLKDLQRWNNLNSSSIRAGQRLKLAG